VEDTGLIPKKSGRRDAMPIAPFHCAMGDSPEVALPCAATVNISPGDDSVDTNRVRITGTGTISSFGVACDGVQGELGEPATVTKRIAFVPTAPGITLQHNPPGLSLLGAVNRTITANAFGTYQSDVNGNWTETDYTQAAVSPTKGGGALLALITYTASATITIPPGATRAWVRMWGGSGASGAGDGTNFNSSAGTGAPGYLEKFLTGLTPGITLVFTRGNGGTPSASAGSNGTASTLASGTQTIATLTAGGSNGTPQPSTADVSTFAGSAGGTATGGDINRPGQTGGSSAWNGTSFVRGVGGYNSIGRGVDGSASYLVQGNAGINGGLIIAWFNDAFA